MEKNSALCFLSCLAICLLFIFGGCSSSSPKKDNGAVQNTDAAGENVSPGKDIEISSDEETLFTGAFRLKLSGYKGTLFIGKRAGSYFGYIVFQNWGNGKSQELKNLSIDMAERKIFFIRSVKTPEEARKYNANRYFVQKYYGQFTADGKRIKGYYIDSGAESSWQAER